MRVKVLEIDRQGRIRLSMKEVDIAERSVQEESLPISDEVKPE